MDVGTVMKYDVHIMKGLFHNDLERIRTARNAADRAAKWEINLIWKKNGTEDGKEHNLPVYAQGPALAVYGCQTCAGDEISFFGAGSNGKFNYGGETGCRLNMWEIIESLEELRAGRHRSFSEGDGGARRAYVMCVFMASEIVRNEVLEVLFINGTKGKEAGRWEDYILLYKNWALVSELLYGEAQGKGENAGVIRIGDVRAALADGRINEQTMKDRLAGAYRDAMARLMA